MPKGKDSERKSNVAKSDLGRSPKSEVVAPVYKIRKKDGKETFELTEDFRKEVLTFFQTGDQKLQTAINVTDAFLKYQKLTRNGLPAFVSDLFDPNCPRTYGNAGSETRKEINRNKIFNRVDYLVKKGKRELKKTQK
jgi:hypothetical protein